MALEPSVEDRVLEAFLKQLEGSDVPAAVLSRLSSLLSKSGSLNPEEFLRVIREGAVDDAED